MPKRQTTETLEPPSRPSCVNKDQARGWCSDDTRVDTTRKITLYQRSENPEEAISTIGWFSASILHDLRNPLATICAGAELLMDLDSPSTQVKRLAANIVSCCRTDAEIASRLAQHYPGQCIKG